jgi:hypothetical protein
VVRRRRLLPRRKRKSGAREPNGRLAREKRPDDRLRVSRQPHRRGVRADDRLSEKAESVLGRMCLAGILTDAQYEALTMFSALVSAYRAVIEGPRAAPSPIGQLYHPGAHDDPGDMPLQVGRGVGFQCVVGSHGVDACRYYPQQCECLGRRLRYQRAFEALMGDGGYLAARTVRRAVHHEDIGDADLVHLIRGAGALARHFGLTPRGGGANVR